jgi:uncharacterized alkaline shock family protein YloU
MPVNTGIVWCCRTCGKESGGRAGSGTGQRSYLGVDVHYDGQTIKIDLYIVVEYGTRITSVSSSVADNVAYQVEKALGIPVSHVDVHVRGLRISNPD